MGQSISLIKKITVLIIEYSYDVISFVKYLPRVSNGNIYTPGKVFSVSDEASFCLWMMVEFYLVDLTQKKCEIHWFVTIQRLVSVI